jgi:hypothetical protein
LCKQEQGLVETRPDIEVPAIQATYQTSHSANVQPAQITARLARKLAMPLNIAHDPKSHLPVRVFIALSNLGCRAGSASYGSDPSLSQRRNG